MTSETDVVDTSAGTQRIVSQVRDRSRDIAHFATPSVFCARRNIIYETFRSKIYAVTRIYDVRVYVNVRTPVDDKTSCRAEAINMRRFEDEELTARKRSEAYVRRSDDPAVLAVPHFRRCDAPVTILYV